MNINKIRVPERYDRRRHNLPVNTINEIIRSRASFKTPYKVLAKSFGVSEMFICRLCNKSIADKTKEDNQKRAAKNYKYTEETAKKRKEYKNYKKKLMKDLGLWQPNGGE